jgi:PncC family amidohydrolase
MIDTELAALAATVLAENRAAGRLIATAESCTGGLVAAALTEIAGSSDVVDRGFVTYSNDAKMDMLGVPADVLAAHGAVSEPTALAMATGALAHSRAAVTVAITGIAGQTGWNGGVRMRHQGRRGDSLHAPVSGHGAGRCAPSGGAVCAGIAQALRRLTPAGHTALLPAQQRRPPSFQRPA